MADEGLKDEKDDVAGHAGGRLTSDPSDGETSDDVEGHAGGRLIADPRDPRPGVTTEESDDDDVEGHAGGR
jgi:hypothetical protein